MTLKKIILLAAFSALLGACGTKVPLTEPAKVEDRSSQSGVVGTNVIPNSNANANQANLGTRDVKPVVSDAASSVLGNVIFFDFDSYIVRPDGQRVLEGQAKALTANRNTKVSLAGHTDDLGGREYNLALGQKRADAVKKALSILGVTDAQMESISYGKEKPVNAGTDDVARAANRRVEVSGR